MVGANGRNPANRSANNSNPRDIAGPLVIREQILGLAARLFLVESGHRSAQGERSAVGQRGEVSRYVCLIGIGEVRRDLRERTARSRDEMQRMPKRTMHACS